MKYVMKAIAIETKGRETAAMQGQFLKSYDIEAHDGQGEAEWTTDINQAIHFDGLKEAMEAWQTRSRVRPTRVDGRPNKPLTAFSVTFEPLTEPTSDPAPPAP